MLEGEAEAQTPGQELFVSLIEYLDEHDGAPGVLEYALRYHNLRYGPLVFRGIELPPRLDGFSKADLEAMRRARADHVVDQWQELESNYTELLGLLRDISFQDPDALHDEEWLLLDIVRGEAAMDAVKQASFERVPKGILLAGCGLARILKRRELRSDGKIEETLRYEPLSKEAFTGGNDAFELMSPYKR